MEAVQQFLPLLYSKREAARLLSVSVRTLHALVEAHQLRTVHVGRRVLVPHAALVEFCDNDHPTSLTRPRGTTGMTKRTRKQVAPQRLVTAQNEVNRVQSNG